MQLKTLFSELYGFILYDKNNLLKFVNENKLGKDILTPLTETELGEEISENGIAIPIIGLEADDYGFLVSPNLKYFLKDNQVKVHSKGWILNSEGILYVCGIGYLKHFDHEDLLKKEKVLKFDIPKGWLEIEIVGGLDNNHNPIFEIVVKSTINKPTYNGDLSTQYAF